MPRSNKRRRQQQETARQPAAERSFLSGWLRIPVALAFALGVILMAFLAQTVAGFVLFWAAVFLLSFSLAHLASKALFRNRRAGG